MRRRHNRRRAPLTSASAAASSRHVVLLAPVATLAVFAVFAVYGVTTSNTVPATRFGTVTNAVTANDLKPAACAALTLTGIFVGSGNFNGPGGGSTLLMGGSGNDRINAKGAADCVLGGAGDDTITGGGGSDVCIGGPGSDTFSRCETVIQ